MRALTTTLRELLTAARDQRILGIDEDCKGLSYRISDVRELKVTKEVKQRFADEFLAQPLIQQAIEALNKAGIRTAVSVEGNWSGTGSTLNFNAQLTLSLVSGHTKFGPVSVTDSELSAVQRVIDNNRHATERIDHLNLQRIRLRGQNLSELADRAVARLQANAAQLPTQAMDALATCLDEIFDEILEPAENDGGEKKE